ncbi:MULTISPECIES: MFS transporter [Lactococcus]|nr:MFS transporter [Lactococcus garvieae]
MKKMMIYNGFSHIMPELVVWMIYLKINGWSVAEIALVQGLFTLFSTFFELPSGIIADRFGRKRTLQIGEIFCVLYLLTFFFPTNHTLIAIGMFLFAIGLSLISGADVSLLYNIVEKESPKNYLKYVGRFNAIGILAMALGNLSGGIIANTSWKLLFVFAISLRLISFIIISRVKEVKVEVDLKDIGVINQFNLILSFFEKRKTFILLLVCTSLSIAAITSSYQFAPVIFENMNLSTVDISIIFGVISVLGAIFAFLPDKLSAFISSKSIISLSLCIAMLMFLLIALFPNTIFLVIISIIIPNILFEAWNVILDTFIQEQVTDNIRSSIFSILNLVASLAITLISFIVSMFSNKLSLIYIISLTSCFLLSISLISFIIFNWTNKNSKHRMVSCKEINTKI